MTCEIVPKHPVFRLIRGMTVFALFSNAYDIVRMPVFVPCNLIRIQDSEPRAG